MFLVASVRASDGGGAYRIDIKRNENAKSEAFFILALHQRKYDFKKGEYPDAAYDVLCRLDAVCKGVKSGRRILGYGANSASALRSKLIAKGLKAEYSDEAVAILQSEIGLDENRDALRLCELQIAKNIGARRIIAYLRGRGYSEDALTAVREYLAQVDFIPVCRKSIIKKYGDIPSDFDTKKKCIDYLLRQGFLYNEIKGAFEG